MPTNDYNDDSDDDICSQLITDTLKLINEPDDNSDTNNTDTNNADIENTSINNIENSHNSNVYKNNKILQIMDPQSQNFIQGMIIMIIGLKHLYRAFNINYKVHLKQYSKIIIQALRPINASLKIMNQSQLGVNFLEIRDRLQALSMQLRVQFKTPETVITVGPRRLDITRDIPQGTAIKIVPQIKHQIDTLRDILRIIINIFRRLRERYSWCTAFKTELSDF